MQCIDLLLVQVMETSYCKRLYLESTSYFCATMRSVSKENKDRNQDLAVEFIMSSKSMPLLTLLLLLIYTPL